MSEEKENNEEYYDYESDDDITVNIYTSEDRFIDTSLMMLYLFSTLNSPRMSYLEYLENQQMRAAIRESEDMYKYLEKKDIEIDKKKIIKYGDIKTELTECVICKDDFSKEDEVIELKCSHVFHERCLNEAVKYIAKCPMCRDDVDCKEKDKKISDNK
jgi:hypothetical protein